MDDLAMRGMARLKHSLPIFCAHLLHIADKQGAKRPLLLNQAQQHVHDRLQAQLRQTGKVRALILKGRQQGISTYVAARFYHQCTTRPGTSALIVGHEQKSTDSLYAMVKHYQANNPLGISTGATNAKELIFDKLGSGYKLATAKSDDVGRGNTLQLAHLSEFAFWRNAQQHMAGLGNTIADLPGTEIIIESTANGIGNAYHQMWQAAEAGLSELLAIFVPWYLKPEYRAPVQSNLQDSLSQDDQAYMHAYSLDMEQMQWRANKISTYGADHAWLFRQEYPATPAEAFATSSSNSLITGELIQAATQSDYLDPAAPLVIGCDPAGEGESGADRTAIAYRQGRVCRRIEYHSGLNTMQIAGRLAECHRTHNPAAIFVDKGGLGAGVFDRLRELGVPVIGINSASRANDTELYDNKRAEMWWLMRAWLEDTPVRLPKSDALMSDLAAPQPKLSSNGRRLLEKKEDMKKRGIRSPDGADALALTFAEPVAASGAPWTPSHPPRRRHRTGLTAGY